MNGRVNFFSSCPTLGVVDARAQSTEGFCFTRKKRKYNDLPDLHEIPLLIRQYALSIDVTYINYSLY